MILPMNLDQILGDTSIIPGYTTEAEENLKANRPIAVILLERVLGTAEEYGIVEYTELDYPRITVDRGAFYLEVVPSPFGALTFYLHWTDLLVFAAYIGIVEAPPTGQATLYVHLLAWDRAAEVVRWEPELFATFSRDSEYLLSIRSESCPRHVFALLRGECIYGNWGPRLARELEVRRRGSDTQRDSTVKR
jgi:hypothetical protein